MTAAIRSTVGDFGNTTGPSLSQQQTDISEALVRTYKGAYHTAERDIQDKAWRAMRAGLSDMGTGKFGTTVDAWKTQAAYHMQNFMKGEKMVFGGCNKPAPQSSPQQVACKAHARRRRSRSADLHHFTRALGREVSMSPRTASLTCESDGVRPCGAFGFGVIGHSSTTIWAMSFDSGTPGRAAIEARSIWGK